MCEKNIFYVFICPMVVFNNPIFKFNPRDNVTLLYNTLTSFVPLLLFLVSQNLNPTSIPSQMDFLLINAPTFRNVAK